MFQADRKDEIKKAMDVTSASFPSAGQDHKNLDKAHDEGMVNVDSAWMLA